MTSRSLYRAAAIALGFAAFTTVSGYLAHPAADVGEMAGPAWQVSHMLLWMGGLAAAFGIVGLYLRHRQRVGRAGTLGAGAAILGLLGLTGAYFHESIIVPALAQQAPELMRTFPGDGTWASYRIAVASSGAAVGVGFALFGVKMIRTRAVPIWAAATTSLGAFGSRAAVRPTQPHGIDSLSPAGTGIDRARLRTGGFVVDQPRNTPATRRSILTRRSAQPSASTFIAML